MDSQHTWSDYTKQISKIFDEKIAYIACLTLFSVFADFFLRSGQIILMLKYPLTNDRMMKIEATLKSVVPGAGGIRRGGTD